MLRAEQGPRKACGFKIKGKVGDEVGLAGWLDVAKEGAYVPSAASRDPEPLLRGPVSVPWPLRVCQEERGAR